MSTSKEHAEAYLNLKPLKSLKDNFDIDIASCLQEYLKELTGTDTSTSLNEAIQKVNVDVDTMVDLKTDFINAALVLQNSSNVYSRKVEYLYSLVYESLEALQKASDPGNHNGQKNGSRRSNSNGKGVDPDVEEFQNFDPDWNFLVFDEDTVPIDVDGTRINLPPSSTEPLNGIASPSNTTTNNDGQTNHTNNTPQTHNHMNNTTRISLGGGMGMSITKLDQTLHTVTQNKTTIQSHAAQQLIQNLLHGSHGNNGAGGFDMSHAALRLMNGVCDVSESGALLLPGTGKGEEHDHDGYGDEHGEDGDYGMGVAVGAKMEHGQRLDMDMTMESNGHDHSHEDYNGDGFDFNTGGDDYDDGDDGGDGFVIHSPADMNDNNPDDEQSSTLRHAAATTTNPSATVNENEIANAKPKSSPWDMMDPHDDSEAKSRPMRVAITYRLPHDCDSPPSSSVTGGMTKKVPRERVPKSNKRSSEDDDNGDLYVSRAVREYRNTLSRVENRRRRSSMDLDNDDESKESTSPTDDANEVRKALVPLPIKGSAFGDEFLYVAKAQAKLKAAEKRRLKRMQSEQRNESKNAIITNERFEDIYDDNDDDGGPAFDFAGGDDDDYSAGSGEGGGDNANDSNERLDAFSGVFGNDQAENGEISDSHRTFEELCRAHLKEFAKGAERFAVETQMSRKVASWQERLQVILTDEDARQEFDINIYGDRIISRAEESLAKQKSVSGKRTPQDTVDFISITKAQEPYEVCRTFLASLMLCNSENVVFSGSCNNGVSSPDDLQLKVLKKDTNSPLETYLAPSVASSIAQTDAIMA